MKHSLHIGINDYPGTRSDLKGCVNDARDWQDELTKRGFNSKIILNKQCTYRNMVNEITKIVESTGAGDICVITYSGHGTWVRDVDGDEADGRDEGLCPYDVAKGLILLDDELFKIFSKRHEDSKLIFISDSCHSGTVSRGILDFSEDVDGTTEIIEKRFLETEPFLDPIEKTCKVAPLSIVEDSVMFFSGCADIEYSYDASFQGRPNGAFTFTALNAIKKLPEDATYKDLYNEIRKSLPHPRYPQTPKIAGSNEQKNWVIFS